jgi:hypothetical protein
MIGTKTEPASCEQAAPAERAATRKDWVAPLTALAERICQLLQAAVDVDSDDDVNTSERITIQAIVHMYDVKDEIEGAAETTLDANGIAGDFFNVEALVLGALRVGAGISMQRAGYLMAAETLARSTADVFMTNSEEEVGAILSGLMQLVADAPMPDSVRPANNTPTLPPASVITRDTTLPGGGIVAVDLMMACTCEIESLAQAITDEADEAHVCVGIDEARRHMKTARGLAQRVRQLNSLVMSYLGEEGITIREADLRINGAPTVLLKDGAA